MPRPLSKYERAWRERAGHIAPTPARPGKTLSDAELERLTAPAPPAKAPPHPPRK